MFVKVTSCGARRYVQLVESYRDEAGRPRQKTVATLGRLEDIGEGRFDSLINGLLRITGRGGDPQAPDPEVVFERARSLGDVWVLSELWKQLGFDRLARVFRSRRIGFDVEAMIRTMVFNRLCDPESKLGVLRWLETVAIPGIDARTVTHRNLLRAMDAWNDHRPQVDAVLAGLLRPLVDSELSVVFYDVTTIEASGATELPGDLRAWGRSKRDTIERQIALGVVQTAEGLPIAYEVFEGNVAETTTLMSMVERVIARFGVRRVVLVADRGLLSMDNVERLQTIRLPSGAPLEFILALPARRYSEFAPLIAPLGCNTDQWVAECLWTPEGSMQALRLVVAHDSQQAQVGRERRRQKIGELEALAAQWAAKLDAQDEGALQRGRRLSDSGAKSRFYHAVMEARLGSVIKVDLTNDLFAYQIHEPTLDRLETLDGKLAVLTNVADLDAPTIIERYKALADIERGFRVLKSDLEIGPVYHRLPQRIDVHAGLCFMALILHRVMRMRLKAAHARLSPDRALAMLRAAQHHRIRIRGTESITGISAVDYSRSEVLAALGISKPTTTSPQIPLL